MHVIGTQCVLMLGLAWAGQIAPDLGEMRGTVVNATRGGALCPDTEVILRLQLDGQFVPVAQTTTSAKGEFRFTGLPVGPQFLYLPGANRHDIHYPGKRFRLGPANRQARVTLEVCDSVSYPNPLVIRQHEILVATEPGALRVTESLLVDNPTRATFVGRAEGQGTKPVTLRLSIPPDFDRTTFHTEFYGRRFSLVGGQLVTDIPWTPGQRQLKFTYTLPNDKSFRVWQRPLDLPSQLVRVRVQHDKPGDVSSNLPRVSTAGEGELAFQSSGETLPAGHLVRVQLGRLPLAWMVYARWASLGLLGLLILLGSGAIRRRSRRDPTGPRASLRVVGEAKSPRKSKTVTRQSRRTRRKMAS